MKKSEVIGVIGQGWVGKHFADELENRGYKIIRYSKDKQYERNRDSIKACSLVFIAVPTPTVNGKMDLSALKDAMHCVSEDSIIVLKSTILPGTTEVLQDEFKNLFIMHSPEFLREKNAMNEVAFPERNIVGIPIQNEEYQKKAEYVMSVLPNAQYEKILSAKEAELIKYIGNSFLFTKVVYMNLMHDLAVELGVSYEAVREAVSQDSRIGGSHTFVHDDKKGRGAGGHCFIKDFSAFECFFGKTLPQDLGSLAILKSLREKNNELLLKSEKDLELLRSVYPI